MTNNIQLGYMYLLLWEYVDDLDKRLSTETLLIIN